MRHTLRGIKEKQRIAICAVCGPTTVQWRSDRERWRCAGAEKIWKKNYTQPKRKRRFSNLKGDTCEICVSKENLCSDHSHLTDLFRGTLCRTCNAGLGMFKDNSELLRKAADYLKMKKAPDSQSG